MLNRLAEAMPDTFEAVLTAAQRAAENHPNCDMEHWQLHQDIIQQNFASLLERFKEETDSQVGTRVSAPLWLFAIHLTWSLFGAGMPVVARGSTLHPSIQKT